MRVALSIKNIFYIENLNSRPLIKTETISFFTSRNLIINEMSCHVTHLGEIGNAPNLLCLANNGTFTRGLFYFI